MMELLFSVFSILGNSYCPNFVCLVSAVSEPRKDFFRDWAWSLPWGSKVKVYTFSYDFFFVCCQRLKLKSEGVETVTTLFRDGTVLSFAHILGMKTGSNFFIHIFSVAFSV
jgi:hypothetical protein